MGRPHPALVDLAAGRDLPAVDDEAGLIASAIEHRMTGLLWSQVRGHPAMLPNYRSFLSQQDLVIRARHRRLWETMDQLLTDLRDLGADGAVVKGVPSEARWYEREGERPSRDLDLLLAPSSLGDLGQLLRALEPDHPCPDEIAGLARRGLVQAVELSGHDVSVELHIDPLQMGLPSRTYGLLWDRALAFTLPGGGIVRVPHAEMALVLFLVHLNIDRFQTLIGLADIARVLAREQIDWSEVERIARIDGLETPVGLALDVVTDELGIDTARPWSPSGWRPTVWRALWRPSVRLQGTAGRVRFRRRKQLLPFLARGRSSNAVLAACRRLLPPKSYFVQRGRDERPYAWYITIGRVRSALRWRRERVRFNATGVSEREPNVASSGPRGSATNASGGDGR